MTSPKLSALRRQTNPVHQNRMFFDWLCDDAERRALYAELRDAEFPTLRLKSLLRSGGTAPWPSADLYFVSEGSQVAAALQQESVDPYAHLDSAGRFMLGIDDPDTHRLQRDAAIAALRFSADEIAGCASLAVERALVLAKKKWAFDAVEQVAEEAALRFVALLFGLPPETHVELQLAMRAAYTRLTFQIVGRHFVAESGLPPDTSEKALELRRTLEGHVAAAARGEPAEPALADPRMPRHPVVARLAKTLGAQAADTTFVALGLMAGTVGNVKAAVGIALAHYFDSGADRDRRFQLRASTAVAGTDVAIADAPDLLGELIDAALDANPPAPFLARTARSGSLRVGAGAGSIAIPNGAHLLLAIGADASHALRFGGAWHETAFVHRCIGQRLAEPLIRATVRGILWLPGLARELDPATAKPKPLTKRWGVDCQKLPLVFQRDRLLNQRSLHVVLPIKAPVAENAAKLKLLTEAGAHIVENALRESGNVHFAWFNLVDNNTHLAMSTVYDGDFDAYVEHFALKVPLFDQQFKYLDVEQETPIRLHPKQFVANIRKYNQEPLGDYFFSAYAAADTMAIRHAGLAEP